MPFDATRIGDAIKGAAHAAGIEDQEYCAEVTVQICQQLQQQDCLDIHDIQRAVENQLMAGRYPELARDLHRISPRSRHRPRTAGQTEYRHSRPG